MNAATPDVWGPGVVPRWWQAEYLPTLIGTLRAGKVAPLVSVVTGAGKSIYQRAVVVWALSADRPGIVVVDVPSEALVRQLSATMAAHPALSGRVGQYYGKRKQIPDRGVVIACRDSLPRLATALRVRGVPVRMYMADEAHLSPDRQIAFVAEVKPARIVGVTATPYRASPKESLPLWDEVLFRYSMSEAFGHGVLLEPQILGLPVPMDPDDGSEWLIREHAHRGPVVVNASDIADAEAYAERLTAGGISALAVHSQMSDDERDRRRDMLRDGEIACLVHVATLVEGIDWPWLTTICLRRQAWTAKGDPRKGGSRVRLVQEVGRAMRVMDGKPGCYILDPGGVMVGMGLVHAAALAAVADEEEPVKPRPMSQAERRRKAREDVMCHPLSDLEAWVARAIESAVEMGQMVRPPQGAGWRAEEPTTAQTRNLATRIEGADGGKRRIWLPRRLAVMCELAAARCVEGSGSRGLAADVIGLISAGGAAAHKVRTATGRYPSGDGTWWRGRIPDLPSGLDAEALEA
jgi:superfamily II DNA or RNA helicase